MMRDDAKIRVLHVPTSVGGSPSGISAKEKKLGIDSHSVVLAKTVFAYPADEVLWAEGDNLLMREYKRIRLIFRAARDFDIIHYNFGTTIADPPYPRDKNRKNRYPAWLHWPYWLYASWLQKFELALMKGRGKIIFVTYQGNDARQGDYCRQHFEISAIEAGGLKFYSPVWDAEKRKRIKMFDKYADQIYAFNPDLLHVLPKRTHFMPYLHLDIEDWKPAPSHNKIPHIIHAPSHRGMKGTAFILQAIDRLKQEGVAFTFELVENLSHQEARALYEKSDLLIDQLLIGWYGGVAVEFMALGKPVVCYIRDADLNDIPTQMKAQLPIIAAQSDNIYDILRLWLTNPAKDLKKQGDISRKYIEQWHNQNDLVAQITQDYTYHMEKKAQGKDKSHETL